MKKRLEESKRTYSSLNSQIIEEAKKKTYEIKDLEKNLLNSQAQFDVLKKVDAQTSDYDKQIREWKESLELKLKESRKLNDEIKRKHLDRENFERNLEKLKNQEIIFWKKLKILKEKKKDYRNI